MKGFYLEKNKIKKDIRIAIIPYICEGKISSEQIIIQNNKCKILGNIESNIICDIGAKDIKIGEKVIFPISIYDKTNLPIRREYR